jgi:hypothetical protein
VNTRNKSIINHLFLFAIVRCINDNEIGLSCDLSCKWGENVRNVSKRGLELNESDLLEMLKKYDENDTDHSRALAIESMLDISLLREKGLYWFINIYFSTRTGGTTGMFNISLHIYPQGDWKGEDCYVFYDDEVSLFDRNQRYEPADYYDGSSKYLFSDEFIQGWVKAIEHSFISNLKQIIKQNI